MIINYLFDQSNDKRFQSQIQKVRASPMAQVVKNVPVMQETWVWSLSQEDPLEKGMVTHSSILTWRIPWTEEPVKLQSIELKIVGHGWATNTHTHTHTHTRLPMWLSGKESTCQCRRCRRYGYDLWVWKIPWNRKCQPNLVFLPEKSHGQRSLVGYTPWGHTESDTTEWVSEWHSYKKNVSLLILRRFHFLK